MEHIIYYLFDKTDEKKTPIYVGKTNRSLDKRILKHSSSAHTGSGFYVHYYMRLVGINNICIKEILKCASEKSHIYETIMIELLNPICNTQRCCLSSYKTYGEYKKAWRENNLQAERFKCDICNKCFGDGNRLKVHYDKHIK